MAVLALHTASSRSKKRATTIQIPKATAYWHAHFHTQNRIVQKMIQRFENFTMQNIRDHKHYPLKIVAIIIDCWLLVLCRCATKDVVIITDW